MGREERESHHTEERSQDEGLHQGQTTEPEASWQVRPRGWQGLTRDSSIHFVRKETFPALSPEMDLSQSFSFFKEQNSGTSLVVQWLRLCAPNAGGPGSLPGQGTRSHMPQGRPGAAK